MPEMKRPGVYVVEKNAFPNSVVEVATAVPAFVGYTEKADRGGTTLRNVPTRITSMSEFRQFFGEAPTQLFTLKATPATNPPTPLPPEGFSFGDNPTHTLERETSTKQFLLYQSMLLFFQNGGGPCYIVSVGDYEGEIREKPVTAGIATLVKEQEPTMLVIPDAVRLMAHEHQAVVGQMLEHCGATMRDRIAILDVHDGDDSHRSKVEVFRNAVGVNNLDFGTVYYPWLNTSILQTNDFTFENLDLTGKAVLQELLLAELGPVDAANAEAPADPAVLARRAAMKAEIEQITTPVVEPGATPEQQQAQRQQLHKVLRAISPEGYTKVLDLMRKMANVMPPSAAMAGIYTAIDNSRGVWKAPANVGLNSVVSPTRNVTHEEQEDLNVDTNGKSINAIRSFVGEGVLVWGARTLDGNSLDWRYIQVRRTMIMLEQSIRLAAKAYVFEPNDANTWVTIKGTIRNFLTGIWKRGGLAGASPEDAFQVFVGLGETMTPEDILEGKLMVTILVAVTRPAEFIEITFQQQMQKS